MSFLATKPQKTATGTTMRDTVNPRDLASGPNISLPSRRNICRMEQPSSNVLKVTTQNMSA
jgi:hypothetical protein